MQFPKIYCNSASYRSGVIEVRPDIHPGHVNLEVWNFHPDHDRRAADIADADVVGNTEMELDVMQAKELVRLLNLAIEAVAGNGQQHTNQQDGI